jgi:hypothetical protein
MSQINTREIVLLNTSGTTTSGTGPDINLIQGWQAAVINLNLGTVSGTSPTFDVYIQKKLGQAASTDLAGNLPTGTAIYDDLLHFTQMTTTGIRISQVCTGSQSPTANATVCTTCDWAQSDAALTAGDLRIGPLGGLWRVKFVIGGTLPVGSISIVATLIPFGT